MRLIALALLWMATLATAAAAQAVGSGPFLSGAQSSASGNIEVELVPMSRWVAPGSTTVVALRQRIAPGWHTYWRNPGDSGGATTLDWTLPAGVIAGEIVWPTPERQRLLNLVNYGYSGDVLLPTTIQVPGTARPGSSLALRVTANLFVCSDEMCIPETIRLALDLPVREGAAPLATNGQAIQAVLAAAPRAAGISATFRMDDGAVMLSASGGPLVGTDPGPVWFYPFATDRIVHSAAQSGERGGNGLTLRLPPGRTLSDAPLAGILQTRSGVYEIEAVPGEALAGTAGAGPLAMAAEGGEGRPTASSSVPNLWQAALLALVGGLVLNLMPCVFPVLAMKAASLAQTAHDPAAARRDGLMFLIGVLGTFLLLASALIILRAGGTAVGWGFQLQSPAVTTGLALLMLAVGLNLSGVFQVGAGLQGLGSAQSTHRAGGWGALLTGVLTVVVAAPCTAPFMAVAMGAALVMPWPAALTVFVMLGLGLALPYVLVTLSPHLLARLPRPGAWMERLKGFLAFPMYGAALWLAWVVSRQVGSTALATLMGAGLVLAVALWLYGTGQTLRASGRKSAMPFAGAAIALCAALVLATVTARTPAAPSASTATGNATLPAEKWSPQAVSTALAQGRPVLVNFTADWCVTCKINEGAALSSEQTAKALARANTVYMVADWTRRDDAITTELTRLGRSGVPLYLVYTPGRPEPTILPQLLTEGVVVDALEKAAHSKS